MCFQGLEVKRQGYKESWAEFFEEWDVLLCPVMPTAAFEHDHDMSRGVSVGTAHPAPLTRNTTSLAHRPLRCLSGS
jgi:Asp-tRNA(Asn)/Glu-tRNA(Gln) amidotransferase A subunit family amidase